MSNFDNNTFCSNFASAYLSQRNVQVPPEALEEFTTLTNNFIDRVVESAAILAQSRSSTEITKEDIEFVLEHFYTKKQSI
eukprot:TRINITY_DN3163_c0_g2_i1.p1 TRINITY_DN3163_c0_g2~~TRINITY_DN3163_c0_g2_i1.p1  ORF type:complete len:80 (-),score=21.99 TRINITY_DN3163_c0_g2_i1:40-279(-)